MDSCVIIIDNWNVLREGQLFSAKQKGIFKKNYSDKDICDLSWRIDFGNLFTEVAEEKKISKAIVFGFPPPENDAVWEAAKRLGFTIYTHNSAAAGKEKATVPEIIAQATEIICTLTDPCILKLLSGNNAFIPLIAAAHNRSWETEMWAFTNDFSYEADMAQTVTRTKPLDNLFSKIGYHEFRWPVPISQEFERRE